MTRIVSVLRLLLLGLWLGAAMLLQAVQFSLHAYYLVIGAHHDLNYRFLRGVPNGITQYTTPYWRSDYFVPDLGLYAQDQ